jgi:hypothetical protein
MELLEVSTGNKLEAVIERMTNKDFTTVRKSNDRFDKFDWSVYKKQEVYKIRLTTDNIILGLMCLIDHTDEETNAIEIELLEASVENMGPHKKLDHVAGCLIAFACRESFKRGHDGCIFLTPKTSLLNHYPAKYGFHHMPWKTEKRPEGFMILYEDGSRRLIRKYLD